MRRGERYAVSADVVAIRTLRLSGACSAPAGAGDFLLWRRKSPKTPLETEGFKTSLALCVVRCRCRLPRDGGNAGGRRLKSDPFPRLLSLSLRCALGGNAGRFCVDRFCTSPPRSVRVLRIPTTSLRAGLGMTAASAIRTCHCEDFTEAPPVADAAR